VTYCKSQIVCERDEHGLGFPARELNPTLESGVWGKLHLASRDSTSPSVTEKVSEMGLERFSGFVNRISVDEYRWEVGPLSGVLKDDASSGMHNQKLSAH
jgi:hypothetical protein